jgi:V8-like Glu-specific endopeptidase
LLALIAPVPAQAAPTSIAVSSTAQARGALRFWTPARMRRAHPLSVQPAGGARVVAPSARGLHGNPYRYPARGPAAGSARASSAFQPVLDPTLPGDSQNGAIFISLGGGETARCSGTSVNAPNLSVVITAGHCVHDAGEWFDHRWVFVPGYHDGARPFGVFPAKWIGTTPEWLASADENFDVGAAVVSRNERGQRLAAAVGGDGIAWGLSPAQVFNVFGYPVAPPFDGASQRLCSQTAFEGHDVASFFWPGPLNMAVQCDVTGGASGGGWVIAGDVLNGVTTYGYPSDPNTDFGPYFGKAVGRLFGQAARVR